MLNGFNLLLGKDSDCIKGFVLVLNVPTSFTFLPKVLGLHPEGKFSSLHDSVFKSHSLVDSPQNVVYCPEWAPR